MWIVFLSRAHAQYSRWPHHLETMLAMPKTLPYVALTSKDGSDLPKRALEQLIDKGALTDKWWEA